MKQARLASLYLVYALSAFADFTATTTLSSGTALNVETGATAAAGADFLWSGSAIAPQGRARALKIPSVSGSRNYQTLDDTLLRSFVLLASPAPIQAANLAANDIVLVVTNNANLSKVLITAIGSGSLSITFTTYGVSSSPGAPVLKAVLNNSSQIAPGRPNYGIAPSSLFIVTGSGLADPSELVLQSSQPPGLPLQLNGASISVTVNGVTVRPPIYYTTPTQIAAVLPARTPVGTGTLTVTHGSITSTSIPIQVIPAALGFNTYDVNTAVATDAASGAVLTYTDSGTQGQTVVLWSTGLGSDPEDSDNIFSTSPKSVNTPLQIYIGGIQARVLYAGSSGYPGVNQINVVIPDTAPSGCWVSIAAVVSNTILSNVATLPINRGGGACVDSVSGLTGSQIFNPAGLTSFRTGFVSLSLSNNPGNGGGRTTNVAATAAFQRYSALSFNTGNSLSPGGCAILTPQSIGSITALRAGSISLSGPNGLEVTLASTPLIGGAFASTLPATAIPSSGGVFTFKGTGGADVGAFTSTIEFQSPLFSWTNSATITFVDKTRGLNVSWTGGNPGSLVSISGGAGVVDRNTNAVTVVSFMCLAPVEAGQFTVPSYIMLGIPTGNGSLMMQNQINGTLNASGLDLSLAFGSNSYSISVPYSVGTPATR